MLWAASTLCFFGFLRMGEAVAPSDAGFDARYLLAYGDVRFNSPTDPSWMEVTIKRSKCDQFGRWVTLSIGATRMATCHLAVMLSYLAQRGSRPGSLFAFENGRLLTRDRFVAALRAALETCGIDPTAYAGQRFWVGAATTAAARGLQDSLIKALGRWDSSAYTVYIRTPRATLISVAQSLVSWTPTSYHSLSF